MENFNTVLEEYEIKIETMANEFNNLIALKVDSITKLKTKLKTLENNIILLENDLEEKTKLVIIHSKNIEVNNKKYEE